MPKSFIQNLNELRTRNGKKKRLIVMARPKSFKSIERDYLRDLLPALQFLREQFLKELLPEIERAVKSRDNTRPKNDSAKIRNDEWSDNIEEALKQIKTIFRQRYPNDIFRAMAERIGKKIDRENRDIFDKALVKEYGIPAVGIERWQQQEIKAFVKENVSLITSIQEDYFSQVERVVMREVQAGTMTKDIANKIEDRFGVTESRAALIARDQTNKFNGNLSQIRQTSIGVKKYMWRTAEDDRVRPEHEERDGEIFYWNDAPADGHPGQAINCRCIALAVFEEED